MADVGREAGAGYYTLRIEYSDGDGHNKAYTQLIKADGFYDALMRIVSHTRKALFSGVLFKGNWDSRQQRMRSRSWKGKQ